MNVFDGGNHEKVPKIVGHFLLLNQSLLVLIIEDITLHF